MTETFAKGVRVRTTQSGSTGYVRSAPPSNMPSQCVVYFVSGRLKGRTMPVRLAALEVLERPTFDSLTEAQRKMLLAAAKRPRIHPRTGEENNYAFIGGGQASTAKKLHSLNLGGYVETGAHGEAAKFWIWTDGYEVAAEAGIRPKGEEGRKEMVARLTSINPMGNYDRLTDNQLRETLARHEESPHSKALRRGAMSR